MILYVEAFMLLHQEKKESEDYHLLVWRSERKPNGAPRREKWTKFGR